MLYFKLIESDSIRVAVLSQIYEMREGTVSWRTFPQSVFVNLRPNASSNKLKPNNKFVELFKGYRMVSISLELVLKLRRKFDVKSCLTNWSIWILRK